MPPYRFAVVAVVALIAAAAAVLVLASDDSGDEPATGAGEALGNLRDVVLPPGDADPDEPPVPGPRFDLARVRSGGRAPVHAAPGGEIIANLDDQTEFGSPRAMWVAERRWPWLGVPLAGLPNGKLGWIRYDREALIVYDTQYSIVADLSQRLVEIRYGDRVLLPIPVTVGRPGSETPPGEYSVTDALAGGDLGAYYGCCVMALTGHQPNLPPDWIGGDRIAIHGTPGSPGGAASLGCLRASDANMAALFALVPLGAPVFIRA
jgi:hypothetical protein